MINLSSVLFETFSQVDFYKVYTMPFLIITLTFLSIFVCCKSGLRFAFEMIKEC